MKRVQKQCRILPTVSWTARIPGFFSAWRQRYGIFEEFDLKAQQKELIENVAFLKVIYGDEQEDTEPEEEQTGDYEKLQQAIDNFINSMEKIRRIKRRI